MKKKLELDDQTARSLYKTADNSFKILLEENWGKEFFSEKLSDRIKTIEDVYNYLGRIMPTKLNYHFLPEEQREKAVNNQYIIDIATVFNKGWIPDFTNTKQKKWYNWFERKSSGWLVYGVSYRCYSSDFGSGFYFENEADARYCGTQFLSIYSIVLE